MMENGQETSLYSVLSHRPTHSSKSRNAAVRKIHQSLSQPNIAVCFFNDSQPVRCLLQLTSEISDFKQNMLNFYVYFPYHRKKRSLEGVKLSQPEIGDLSYYKHVVNFVEEGQIEAAKRHPTIPPPNYNEFSRIDGYWLNRCFRLTGENGYLVVFLSAAMERHLQRYIRLFYQNYELPTAFQQKEAVMFHGFYKMIYGFEIAGIDEKGVVNLQLTDADGGQRSLKINVMRAADLSFEDTQSWLDLIKRERSGFRAAIDMHDYEEDAWITLFFRRQDCNDILDWYAQQGLEEDNDGFIRSEGT